MAGTFLQAEWRKLAMANYAVDKRLLEKYIPPKTELDLWNGTCYLSLIGFMFLDTKVKGIKVPFHANFEEVNIRFYVRYNDQGTWKRGVVFISEIVPKPALTFVANTVYGEKYRTMRMDHSWHTCGQELTVEYKWKKKSWNSFRIKAEAKLTPIAVNSEEEFITEHYWGYTSRANGTTSGYGVEHPRWDVHRMIDYAIDVDFADVYGAEFGFLKDEKPRSVFLAEGSEIRVMEGGMI